MFSMLRASLGLIALPLLVAACASSLYRPRPTPSESACPSLPEGFEATDLVGTWEAEYGAATDTLILIEDGTYEQIYIRHSDGYSFTATDKRWSYETAPRGQSYLHLDGMRRCENTDELCANEAGGGGEFHYWDFCLDRLVTMPDEVILMVTGFWDSESSYPEGVRLWHMAADPDSGSYWFVRTK